MKYSEDYHIPINKFKSYEQFLNFLSDDESLKNSRRLGTYFDLVENEVIEDDRKIVELIDSYSQIKENLQTLIEKRHVLHKASQLTLDDNFAKSFSGSMMEQSNQSSINFISGVVKADDVMRMRRMIFRISRGRAITTFWDLNEEEQHFHSHLPSAKVVQSTQNIKKIFTIFFQQDSESRILEGKLINICDIFNASRYAIPPSTQIPGTLANLDREIQQTKDFLVQSENSIQNFLFEKVGQENLPGKYVMYQLYFRKEKTIYINLNKCLARDTFIDGEVWIPEKKYQHVKAVLANIHRGDEGKLTANLSDGVRDPELVPPTFLETNDFLWAFQEIVNTYGIPRYREINPTYFNIVTFPFLFGVMFGDIGHGFLLFLFGAYLCLWKDNIEKDNSMLKPILKARYLLLMMGFFAFYCGLMYNDFFSIPIGIFGSCYHNEGGVAVRNDKNCVYPFGLDPKWYSASNELSFFNSLKMKLSVIFGVLHMLFGIILRGANSVHFGLTADIFFQFIPQLVFMSILFGYMDVMIVLKWTKDWSNDPSAAPSLITQLMNIFLKLGSVVRIKL